MKNNGATPYLDVKRYPHKFLHRCKNHLSTSVTYMREWDDGFGARGWKLNAAIGDPAIIASTRETGQQINTSVFVHDILDHFLSGFGISGHRSEAMALIQLSNRTGSDPRPDYEQLIKEDIMNGRVNGEGLMTFLPTELSSMLPTTTGMSDREIMAFLKGLLGEPRLTEFLVENFGQLGKAGEHHAIKSWKKLGLDHTKQTAIGITLQNLLERIDCAVEEFAVDMLVANVLISNERCGVTIQNGWGLQSSYHDSEIVEA